MIPPSTPTIYICHHCTRPTFIDDYERQFPGVPFGKQVDHIEDDKVSKIYAEARRCTSAGSYTAAVMCCRKILMHVAVDKGADEGKSFREYVNYLSENCLPKNAKGWVDKIRTLANDMNHEIILASKDDAEHMVEFSEMLLKLIYEYPARAGTSS